MDFWKTMTKIESPDWVDRYRPHKIDDVILPNRYKKIFKAFVDEGNVPNLLLSGKSGVGKTSIARAMLDEIGCDSIIINGSLEGNIETLRTKIAEFASSVSFVGGRKVILIDEADYIPSQQVQPALRNFMETHSKNASFILTVNYVNRLMPELRSRCTEISFDLKKTERAKIASEYLSTLTDILDKEHVEYDKKVLAEIITKYFPDFRKVIHECQTLSKIGKIDVGVLGEKSDANFKALVELMKAKNFRGTTKWVAENYDISPLDVMRKLYDTAYDLITPSSVPSLVVTIGEYQYKHTFVADQEINLLACLANIMADVQWI